MHFLTTCFGLALIASCTLAATTCTVTPPACASPGPQTTYLPEPCFPNSGVCYPTNYYAASDQGQLSSANGAFDAQLRTKCQILCGANSQCLSFVGTYQKAADNSMLATGVCYLYSVQQISPRQCANPPSGIVAYYKQRVCPTTTTTTKITTSSTRTATTSATSPCSTNLSTDNSNCGKCGHICSIGSKCQGGTCVGVKECGEPNGCDADSNYTNYNYCGVNQICICTPTASGGSICGDFSYGRSCAAYCTTDDDCPGDRPCLTAACGCQNNRVCAQSGDGPQCPNNTAAKFLFRKRGTAARGVGYAKQI